MPNVKFEKTKESNVGFRAFIVVDSQGETHKIDINRTGGHTVSLPSGKSKIIYVLTGQTKGYIDVDRTHSQHGSKSDRYQIRSGHSICSYRLFMV